MEEKKISIIIPVYNVEQYIRECLDSVCNQLGTDGKYEIILINDGSTDHSASICKEYADKYSQIHFISQENQGLSETRNAGIRQSQGQYIMFVDSDDYIAGDLLVRVEQQLSQNACDVLFLEGFKVYPNGSAVRLDDAHQMVLEGKEKAEVLEEIAKCNKFPASPCTKICKRQLLIEHGLWFEKGKISEDIAWSVNVYLHAKTFGQITGPAYYYRQGRNSSITGQVTEKRISDLSYAIQQSMESAADYPDWKPSVYAMMAYEVEVLLLLYGQAGKESRKNHKAVIKKLQGLFAYRKGKRTRLISMSCRLLGIRITSGLLAKLYWLREKRFDSKM